MRVLREPVTDLYVDGDRAAVLVREKVAILSDLATSAVLAVPDDGLTLDQLADHLVGRFGDPGNAAALTRGVVDDLAELGVLRLEER